MSAFVRIVLALACLQLTAAKEQLSLTDFLLDFLLSLWVPPNYVPSQSIQSVPDATLREQMISVEKSKVALDNYIRHLLRYANEEGNSPHINPDDQVFDSSNSQLIASGFGCKFPNNCDNVNVPDDAKVYFPEPHVANYYQSYPRPARFHPEASYHQPHYSNYVPSSFNTVDFPTKVDSHVKKIFPPLNAQPANNFPFAVQNDNVDFNCGNICPPSAYSYHGKRNVNNNMGSLLQDVTNQQNPYFGSNSNMEGLIKKILYMYRDKQRPVDIINSRLYESLIKHHTDSIDNIPPTYARNMPKMNKHISKKSVKGAENGEKVFETRLFEQWLPGFLDDFVNSFHGAKNAAPNSALNRRPVHYSTDYFNDITDAFANQIADTKLNPKDTRLKDLHQNPADTTTQAEKKNGLHPSNIDHKSAPGANKKVHSLQGGSEKGAVLNPMMAKLIT